MKSILTTCALFLVLPWKLTGEITHRPSSTRQHEATFTDHKTTISDDQPTIFSPKNSTLSLKPNGQTTHSPISTRLHKDTTTDHETTMGDGPTIFSPNNIKSSSKPNSDPSSTSLHKGDQEKEHEKTTQDGDKYSTEANEKVLSSKSPPQTSEHPEDETSLTHGTYQVTHAMTMSTVGKTPSSHLSFLPFLTELTQKNTITPPPQDMSEEVITTRDDQTLPNFKSTNKGIDRHTQGNRTTRSAEVPQTDISTHLQKPPEVTTNQSEVDIQTTETLTTKWSSLPHENESTQSPVLNITESNGTLDISKKERNGTATYPFNTSTTTGFSTGLGPNVKTEVGTSGTTDTTDTKATYEITTKDMISERKPSTRNSEPNPTTQTDNTEITPKSTIKENHKRHPGHIVAFLIGSILLLMFIAFVVVLVRNHRMKKKQMENTDWAGPSPFIEGDIHPNPPTLNEDGPFRHQESKRISLYSFLPQRLSQRFSMLSPTDEVVPLEDIQVSSTFGQHNVQPLNGKAAPDQIQTHDANSSPPVVSLDSNVPENVSIPPAPENNENIQPAPKLDEIIPAPTAETKTDTPTPFEDVELNASLNNTESTSPLDAIHIPSPPPLPPT